MASFPRDPAQGSVVTSGEELSLLFQDWKHRYDSEIYPNLEEIPYFSPSWVDLWDRAWAEYDALEHIRLEKGFDRQIWQEAMEKDRRQTEGMKVHRSKDAAFTTHDWAQAPLGMVLERFEGRPSSAWNGAGDNADTALDRWLRFADAMAGQARFQESLSISQRVSGIILRDWWSGKYQDRKVLSLAIDSIKAVNFPSSKKTYFFGEPHPSREVFAEVRTSVYNSMMLALFYKEFSPHGWFPFFKDISFVGLRRERHKAIQHATAQRMAYTAYMRLKGHCVYAGGSYLSSMDEPCPWLAEEYRQKGMPYFLWDVERRQTVSVSDLGFEPEYCCVSHTWGRWRKEAISIDGVPWLVPQNQRFDIELLPEHLQRIRPRPHFVWIDLFCIPQDGSPKADEEIDRQAIIFQNAARCIAWMNDVREWDNTMKALNWLGVAYLHATTCPGVYDTESVLNSMLHDVNVSSEFFTAPDDLEDAARRYLASKKDKSAPPPIIALNGEKLAEPACWFSSLWTLQEAMLCPELTFVTRDWVPLADGSGVALPLDALFTFIDVVDMHQLDDKPYEPYTTGSISAFSRNKVMQQTGRDQSTEWPDGPRQLRDLCLITRIDNLLESPSPIGLLLLANSRVSTGSRAPAIMSALGITDWYKPLETNHKDLVLNCYPLNFVKEAAEKIGASFYLSVSTNPELPTHHDVGSRSLNGSMMPFSTTSGWFSRIVGMPLQFAYAPHDHPAIKSWSINRNGSVIIKRAGIVASSKDPTSPEDPEMTIHFMKRGYPNPQISRFGDWSKTFAKDVVTYAVSLSRDSGRQNGVILQGIRNFWFSARRLVKVGTFITPQTELPVTVDVDWIVL